MDLATWLDTPVGRRCLANEQHLVREALDRVFGEQLLQIGLWGGRETFLPYARTQRATLIASGAEPDATHDFAAPPAGAVPPGQSAPPGLSTGPVSGSQTADLVSVPDHLAVASDSVDAVFLPHTLERASSPHAVLREADRVLRADGHLIVLGFSPHGLWGLRQLFGRDGYPPGSAQLIPEGRLHDWLELLSFDVAAKQRYCHTLPFERVQRFASFPSEAWASRWLPPLAAGYLLAAQKRVVRLTPIRPSWRRTRLRAVRGLVEPTTRASRSRHTD